MIVFLESLRLAFASLRANPLRAVLTILGIVIGVAAVVALTAIGAGSTRAVESRFTAFGTDTITVQSSRFSSSSSSLTESDLTAINETPGVKETVYTVAANATVTQGSSTANATVTGTFPEYEAINHLTVLAGTFFSQFDVDRALPVAVLGATTVDDLNLKPLRAIGQTVRIGGRSYTVVGVLKEQGGVSFGSVDSSIIVPLSAIEGRLVAFHPEISSIRVQAEPEAVDTFSSAVESTLRTQHNLTASDQNDFEIVNASSIASAVSSSTQTLTRLMAAIAAISLVRVCVLDETAEAIELAFTISKSFWSLAVRLCCVRNVLSTALENVSTASGSACTRMDEISGWKATSLPSIALRGTMMLLSTEPKLTPPCSLSTPTTV